MKIKISELSLSSYHNTHNNNNNKIDNNKNENNNNKIDNRNNNNEKIKRKNHVPWKTLSYGNIFFYIYTATF